MGAAGMSRTSECIRHPRSKVMTSRSHCIIASHEMVVLLSMQKAIQGVGASIAIFSAVAHAWTKENRVSRSGHT